MQRLKLTILALILILLGVGTLGPVGAVAAASTQTVADFQSDACSGLTQVDSSQDCSAGGSGVTGVISAVVTVISYIVGAAAIIMILVSGFRYITSGGDANKVSGAKSALIYALIGLAVAGLAQFLVSAVLNQSHITENPCPTNSAVAKDGSACHS